MTCRVIINGSPRVNGRSAALSDLLFESCIADYPQDEVFLLPVATLDISGCVGCNACKAYAKDARYDNNQLCAIDDDMADVYPLIEAADELIVVSPVYFSGAPSQLKAFFDRLQPYYWTRARKNNLRPAILHVIGEGGDAFGFNPLVGEVTSVLYTAGFRLETVCDWVGCVDEDGTILEDARMQTLSAPKTQASAQQADRAQNGEVRHAHAQAASRPKLDLGGAAHAKNAKQAKSAAQSKGGTQSNQPKGASRSKKGARRGK